jgi:hypothetical protein
VFVEIVVAVSDRASNFGFVTELQLQPSGRSHGSCRDGNRYSGLVLAPESSEELIDNMNNGGHDGAS